MGRPLKVEKYKDVERVHIGRTWDARTLVTVTHWTDGKGRDITFEIDESQLICINSAVRNYLRGRRTALQALVVSTEEKV